MKKLLVLACLGLMVSVSFAVEADLQLWFSTSSSTTTPPAPENPVLPVNYSGKVYLWGRSAGSFQPISTTYPDGNGNPLPWNYTGWVGDVWQGISLGNTAGSNITFGGGTITNPNTAAGFSPQARWLTQGDFGWATGDQFNVATLFDRGCGGAGNPAQGVTAQSQHDSQQNDTFTAGFVYTRLGSITITAAPAGGSLFMTIGTGTVARRTGDPVNDRVFLGIGDVGLHVDDIGGSSTVADMTVAPEPASLLLIGLAGLALRRR